MIKMVFSDIDGTLLSSDHQIAPSTKERIREVAEKGIPFILVSARMPSSILPYQQELGLSSPLICYSGALCLQVKGSGDWEELLSITLHRRDVEEIGVVVRRHPSISFSLYGKDRWVVEKADDPWVMQEGRITSITPLPMELTRFMESGHPVHKILCMGEPAEIETLEALLTDRFAHLNIYRSKDTYLEIMSKEASKSKAIEYLLRRYEVDRSEVMAVGDHYNDIDMLRFVGLGIAMGNAPEDVKREADGVTATNDEDGLGRILMEKVLM